MIRRAAGFTLAELTVATGVVAILAMIALPSYLDRLARNQVAEALPLADVLKLTVRPAIVEDARIVPITWLCGHAPPPSPMVAKGTDLPAAFLPMRCR